MFSVTLKKSLTSIKYLQARSFASLFDANSTLVKVRHIENTGTFLANLTDQISVANVPNGGLLMAIAIAAGKEMVSFPEPLTCTGHFVNKALENKQAEVVCQVLNTSRSSATVEIKIIQENILRCTFLSTFGDITKMKGLHFTDLKPPQLPAVDDCVAINADIVMKALNANITLFNANDLRFPKYSEFVTEVMERKVGKKPLLEGWLRFAEPDRKPCMRSLAFFLDSLPPPVLILAPTNWVPTLEYTVHFWNAPNPCPCKPGSTATSEAHAHPEKHKSHPHKGSNWLRVRMNVSYIHNGLMYEDGELWSEDGSTLLATSRQLARVLQPPTKK